MGLFDDIAPEEFEAMDESNSMDKEFMTRFLTDIVHMIGLLPPDELKAHVESCEQSVRNADSIGVMIDPTGWSRARNTGEMALVKSRNAMGRKILEIRQMMESDELLRQEYLKKTGAPRQ